MPWKLKYNGSGNSSCIYTSRPTATFTAVSMPSKISCVVHLKVLAATSASSFSTYSLRRRSMAAPTNVSSWRDPLNKGPPSYLSLEPRECTRYWPPQMGQWESTSQFGG